MLSRKDKWLNGYLAFDQGDWQTAKEIWTEQAETGKAGADTYLGLYAIDPGNPLWLTAIFENLDSFYADQNAYGVEIEASYAPGEMTEIAFDHPEDVYLAMAIEFFNLDDKDSTEILLGKVTDPDLLHLVEARFAITNEKYWDCLDHLKQIKTDVFSLDQAYMSAVCYLQIDELKRAEANFVLAHRLCETSRQALMIDYWRAIMLEKQGDQTGAKIMRERIYAVDPEFKNVAEILGNDQRWNDVMESFYLPAAENPEIIDNQ